MKNNTEARAVCNAMLARLESTDHSADEWRAIEGYARELWQYARKQRAAARAVEIASELGEHE